MALKLNWGNAGPMHGVSVECPHCGSMTTPLQLCVSSSAIDAQLRAGVSATQILACPSCTLPFIYITSENRFIPSQRLGRSVKGLPADLERLYDEARDASSVGAFTACAMVARKVLMNLAVLEGAEENRNFHHYVEYLAGNGFVPKKGRPWVDKIRTKGNEATHEIELVTQADAADIMFLVENLLRFNFEMVGSAESS